MAEAAFEAPPPIMLVALDAPEDIARLGELMPPTNAAVNPMDDPINKTAMIPVTIKSIKSAPIIVVFCNLSMPLQDEKFNASPHTINPMDWN